MEISDSLALGTYYMLKNIEDSGISLGGMVQDWEELVKEFVPSVVSDVSKELDAEDICKCGHHTNDHSYEPSDLSDRLDCDKCGCNKFVSCVDCETEDKK